MIRLARLLATPLLLFALMGFTSQPYGPNGNGTLLHEDDQRWSILGDAKVVADRERGEYSASFGPFIRRMDGQTFRITGYMLPLQTDISSSFFILTRRSASCPFCPPNEPTEAIQVIAVVPVRYTQSPITVEGKIHLVSHSKDGLFYRLDQARLN